MSFFFLIKVIYFWREIFENKKTVQKITDEEKKNHQRREKRKKNAENLNNFFSLKVCETAIKHSKKSNFLFP